MIQLTESELQVLCGTKLFSEISREKLLSMLSCLPAKLRRFGAGDRIVREGEPVTQVGILLSGRAQSRKTDGQGEELVVTLLGPGSFIGILLAASKGKKSPVSVAAQTDACVLLLPAGRLISPCHRDCAEHKVLLRGYLDSVAEHSLTLNDRIDCLIRHSVREKVMTYLTRVHEEQGTPEFTVPMDRDAMAKYLNIERSALSRELSRMQQDGLLTYHKSCFRLL